MRIEEICDILKSELFKNGYEYGFYYDGKKYKPDMSNGFDAEYYNLSKTIYLVQAPQDTIRKKIGTCIDSVVVMKSILEKLSVPCKIWLLYHEEKNKAHTVLTFEEEGRIIYLELTPQSNKPCYGKEILYDDERSFIQEFQKENYNVFDVTDEIIIGEPPHFLLRYLKD